MNFVTEKEAAEKKNNGIMSVLKEYTKVAEIEFVTTPRFIVI